MEKVKLLLIVAALCTTGCMYQSVYEADLRIIHEICGGEVDHISSSFDGDVYAVCTSGTKVSSLEVEAAKKGKLLWMLRSKG